MSKLDKLRNKIDSVDAKIARLYEKRMKLVKDISNEKKLTNIPITDLNREEKVISQNSQLISNEAIRSHYIAIQKAIISESKKYQVEMSDSSEIIIHTSSKNYPIFIEDNSLLKAYKLINLDRKVLIITDNGIPKEYLNILKSQCARPIVFEIKAGEQSKNINTYIDIQKVLLNNNFDRKDTIVALGGGVVGDISAFVASTYMRGIDFYNIPTTLLSQVDSSIGGKTAIDFENTKNIIGTFYQPSAVIIDPYLLSSLDNRQFNNGVAEIIKIAISHDRDFFNYINHNDIRSNINYCIKRSIELKKEIVEKDTYDNSIRQTLNFGHTIGHAIEISDNHNYLHGEAIALGMIFMVSKDVKAKLISILHKYDLPTEIKFDANKLIDVIIHDKKSSNNIINSIEVNEIGQCDIVPISLDDLKNKLNELEERL